MAKINLYHEMNDKIADLLLGCEDSGMCAYVGTYIKSLEEQLKSYKDLEEQGKLLRLPCALGDTVYMVDAYIDIRGVPAWRKDFGELRYRIIESKFRLKDVGLIGKTVFLTYDEAKTALKERSE